MIQHKGTRMSYHMIQIKKSEKIFMSSKKQQAQLVQLGSNRISMLCKDMN